MKAYCIFYGTKYSYNLVVDLQKEFNKCGVSLKCDYIKDFSVIKEHWHKLNILIIQMKIRLLLILTK